MNNCSVRTRYWNSGLTWNMEISHCMIKNAPQNSRIRKVLHITRESKKKKKSRCRAVACFQLVSSSGFTWWPLPHDAVLRTKLDSTRHHFYRYSNNDNGDRERRKIPFLAVNHSDKEEESVSGALLFCLCGFRRERPSQGLVRYYLDLECSVQTTT